MNRLILAITATVIVLAASVCSWPAHRDAVPEFADLPRVEVGALHPRLSPDGDEVVFSRHGAIWRLPNHGAEKRLTDGEGFDIEPAWSPDAKRIAFINSRSFFAGELRLLDAKDGSPVKLPAAVQAQGKLHFHRDGRRILGNFQAAGQAESLAWIDLDSGKLTSEVAPSWLSV